MILKNYKKYPLLITSSFNISICEDNNDELNSDEYIKSGMLAYYDGINNTQDGHSGANRVWKDLSNNGHDLNLSDNVVINDNNLYFNNAIAKEINGKDIDFVTAEIVFKSYEKDHTQILLANNTLNKVWVFINNNINVSLSNTKAGSEFYSIKGNVVTKQSVSLSFTKGYLNGEPKENANVSTDWNGGNAFAVGNRDYGSTNYFCNAEIYCIRLYNRELSEEEITNNYLVDQERFDL